MLFHKTVKLLIRCQSWRLHCQHINPWFIFELCMFFMYSDCSISNNKKGIEVNTSANFIEGFWSHSKKKSRWSLFIEICWKKKFFHQQRFQSFRGKRWPKYRKCVVANKVHGIEYNLMIFRCDTCLKKVLKKISPLFCFKLFFYLLQFGEEGSELLLFQSQALLLLKYHLQYILR